LLIFWSKFQSSGYITNNTLPDMKGSQPPKYSTTSGFEGEFEHGSRRRVLKNKLGIKSKREMDRAEFEALVVAQARYFGFVTKRTKFTAELICRMHRDWLGDIYEWAGNYRTVEMTKDGFTWPPAFLVADNMERFENETLSEHTPLRTRNPQQAAHDLSVVHAEFLLIHPFREGNGRLARWLADLMAHQAGLGIPHYRLSGPGSRQRECLYINAVRKGYDRDYTALDTFFFKTLKA
jgi:cell filamentation protein